MSSPDSSQGSGGGGGTNIAADAAYENLPFHGMANNSNNGGGGKSQQQHKQVHTPRDRPLGASILTHV